MSYHVSEGWYGHGPHGSDLTSSTTELLYFAIRSPVMKFEKKKKKKKSTLIELVKHILQQISNTSNSNLRWFNNCSLSSSFCLWPSTVCKQYPHNFPELHKLSTIKKIQVTIWTPWQSLITQNLLGQCAILQSIIIANKLTKFYSIPSSYHNSPFPRIGIGCAQNMTLSTDTGVLSVILKCITKV